ncbi:hypothetical protein RD110_14805 [Rhodoferax koreense]|uniref:VanZ-like domain-containing protein n=1 Tax=Rhodoferax koreensis TaxID=1842727 RepID=A0A1P8JX16_9BURK|nr:VanZ family protein [Rhodoferax koreense]APW38302.1 hypothetical protein RD110_14805 [Rhodoferax koreense]
MTPDAETAAVAGHRIQARSYRIAIAAVLLLIVYGSLYPLRWDFAHPQDFIWRGRIGLGDLLENVALFVPLGWLLAWYHQDATRRGRVFLFWFVIALVVAAALQWLQKYLPRTPALSDVVFNMLGHGLGWCAGRWSVRLMHRAHGHHAALQAADRFALLMLGVWWVAELFPLIPTIDVSSVVDNVKSLWQRPWWEPRRMLQHVGMTVMGLEAVAVLLASIAWPRPGRTGLVPACAAMTALVLGGKFVVIHQVPGMAVVLGLAGGLALWGVIHQARPARRLAALFAVGLATYLMQAIWPWQWRAQPLPMGWMPFGSSLAGNIESVITNVAFECLCFGSMVCVAVRAGYDWRYAAAGVALLALACEWLQRYLPGRTPEITSVVLALGMGWLVSALAQAAPPRKAAGEGSAA